MASTACAPRASTSGPTARSAPGASHRGPSSPSEACASVSTSPSPSRECRPHVPGLGTSPSWNVAWCLRVARHSRVALVSTGCRKVPGLWGPEPSFKNGKLAPAIPAHPSLMSRCPEEQGQRRGARPRLHGSGRRPLTHTPPGPHRGGRCRPGAGAVPLVFPQGYSGSRRFLKICLFSFKGSVRCICRVGCGFSVWRCLPVLGSLQSPPHHSRAVPLLGSPHSWLLAAAAEDQASGVEPGLRGVPLVGRCSAASAP